MKGACRTSVGLQRWPWWVFLIVALQVSACKEDMSPAAQEVTAGAESAGPESVPTPMDPGTVWEVEWPGAAESEAEAASLRVSRVARGFLPSGEVSPEGYAAYVYLLFADQTEETVQTRRAVAEAYLELFPHVDRPENVNLSKDEMALALAPIRSAEHASAVVRSGHPELMLEAYDYSRARLLLQAILATVEGKRVPRISLVLTESRIDAGESIPSDESVSIVDLDNVSLKEAKDRLQEFQNTIEGFDFEDDVRVVLAQFFELVGCTLSGLLESAPETDGELAQSSDACGH